MVAASLLGALLLRRRSHDDVHSVEGYHRQIHTLESMKEHPAGSAVDRPGAGPKHGYPESAVRPTGSTTVRLIGPTPPAPPPPAAPVPPVTSPPVEEPAAALTFDDGEPEHPDPGPGAGRPSDRAVNSMNRRPRRLAAPALAVAAVAVFIVVLLVAGSHAPGHHPPPATGSSRHGASHRSHAARTTTTTAPPPIVSAPVSSSANTASYQVDTGTYTLTISATSSICWVSVTTVNGGQLFSGTLTPGESHTVPVTGAISIDVGAPSVFAAAVNGDGVRLPAGFQTPLTLDLTPAAAA